MSYPQSKQGGSSVLETFVSEPSASFSSLSTLSSEPLDPVLSLHSQELSLLHLQRMTDDTGFFEHACGRIPRRKEGYSTDDQARALWLCLELLDSAKEASQKNKIWPLLDTYLAFLLWVQKENGHFHNNVAYDRSLESETASDDCLGRSLWACALAFVRLEDESRRIAVKGLLKAALPLLLTMASPRGWAYGLAAAGLLRKHGYSDNLTEEIRELSSRLASYYQKNRTENWHWYEPALTYSNGILPWGMLWGYEALNDSALLDIAKESLEFLLSYCWTEQGFIRPVGNRGWCTSDFRAQWDQQPIDVMKLMLACTKAYELLGEERHRQAAVACRAWFYGHNDLEISLADPRDGSCCDGLEQTGVNMNRGAESTLSFLLAEVMYDRLQKI